MKTKFCAALAAVSLLASGSTAAFAAGTDQGNAQAAVQQSQPMLAPGKAAGVKQAQMWGATTMWIAAGAVVVGGVIIIASNNGGGHSSTSTTSTSP